MSSGDVSGGGAHSISRRIYDALSGKLIGATVAVILAGATGAGAYLWARSKTATQDFIIQTVADELKTHSKTAAQDFIIQTVADELRKSNSLLSEPLASSMASLRQSEVGAVNVGSFTLTPANNSYTLYLYYPYEARTKYSGQLGLRIDGYASNEKWVELQPDKDRAVKIDSTDRTLVLNDYFKALTVQEQKKFNEIVGASGIMKDLRALTFQLAGPRTIPNTPSFDPNSSITVTYVELIYPVIRLEK